MRPRGSGGGALRPRRDDPRRPNLGMPQGRPMTGGPAPMPGQKQQFGPKPGGGGGGWGPQPSWQQRGFESQDAARSVQRQYGLVQQPGGGFGKPDSAFLQRQMDSQGWGIQDQQGSLNSGTPVAIGGARWTMGKNGMDFTGQASDVPYPGMQTGQSYDSAQQTPYGRTRPRRTRTFGQVGY